MKELSPHTASESKSFGEIKLNLKQRKLISAFSLNSRTPPGELGKIVGISKDSVRYNLKKFVELGIIPRSIFIVNPYVFGFKFGSIFLRLKNFDAVKETALIKFIVDHPFTIWCGLVGGEWDLGIHVLSKNSEHFNKISKEIKEMCGGELIDSMTLDVYGMERYSNLIERYREENGMSLDSILKGGKFRSYIEELPARETDALVRLNKLELGILGELAENPNISIANLSDKLGVSFNTVKTRINKLIEKRVILAFHPLINLTSLGLISQAILIEAKTSIGNDKIQEYIKDNPYIGYALKSHGKWDWQLYTATSTQHEFYSVLRKIRSDLSPYVRNTSALLLIQDFKFDFTPEGIKEILKSLI